MTGQNNIYKYIIKKENTFIYIYIYYGIIKGKDNKNNFDTKSNMPLKT